MAIGFLDHIHGMNKKYPTGGAGFFRFADDFFVDSAAGFRGAICKLGGTGERPTCYARCNCAEFQATARQAELGGTPPGPPKFWIWAPPASLTSPAYNQSTEACDVITFTSAC